MKKPNPRPVYFLMLIVSLLTGCSGPEDRVALHLSKGDAFYAEQDFQKARVEFKNVLQIDPNHVEGRFRLAETLEKLGETSNAVNQYKSVIGLQGDHGGALLRMAELYFAANHLEGTRELLTKIPPGDERSSARYEFLLAAVDAREDRLQPALQRVEQLLASYPTDGNATLLAASLYEKDQRPETAVALLQDFLRQQPDHHQIRAILSGLLLKQGDTQSAIDHYRRIVEAKPEATDIRITLARLYAGTEQVAAAEALLREGAVEEQTQELGKTDMRLALVTFLHDRKGFNHAAEELQQMISVAPEEANLVLALGELHERADNREQAKKIYLDAIETFALKPAEASARNRLAALLVREGKLEAALTELEAILNANGADRAALMMRASIANSQQRHGDAIADYRALLKDAPNDHVVLRLLAETHRLNGEPLLARDTWGNALIAQPRDAGLKAEFARALLAMDDPNGAEHQLLQAVTLDNDNPALVQSLAEVQISQKKWSAARETLSQLMELTPQSPLPFYLLGSVELAEQQHQAALEMFQQSLAIAPSAVEPLERAVKLLAAQKEFAQALTLTDVALADNADNAIAHHLRGTLLQALERIPEAVAAFEQASAINPRWPLPYLGLAETLRVNGETQRATVRLQQALDATDKNPLILTTLADWLEKDGRRSDALAVMKTAYEAQPQSLVIANNFAMMSITHDLQPADSTTLMAIAEQLRSSANPAFVDTAAWIEAHTGSPEKAIALLKPLVTAHPDSAEFLYHLGISEKLAGNNQAAREHLTRALALNQQFRGRDAAREILEQL
ncbi:MAG TPA: hypothetical protein DCF45_07515 [Gammaproteobacteria bacterium]|nr:hypothetical protein [Gammaproteobacteria bacterium]